MAERTDDCLFAGGSLAQALNEDRDEMDARADAHAQQEGRDDFRNRHRGYADRAHHTESRKEGEQGDRKRNHDA